MKIIENHADEAPWWIGRKGRCMKCGSVLLLEEGDAITLADVPNEPKNMKAFVECPACGEGGAMIYRDDLP